jgi:ribose-phosphate pyrophosphokinase
VKKLKLFALDSSREYGEQVAQHLGIPLSEHEESCFDDGECYVAPQQALKENCRGNDVFVIQSCYSDDKENINQKLMKLFIFLGALRDASAKRITVCTPYYPYARQDRKTNSRAPITTKYLARLFKSMWADRLLALDVHNPTAIQNSFHIPVDLLEATNLFAVWVHNALFSGKDVSVLSPDSGGLGRARRFRKVLSNLLKEDVGIACLDKIHQGCEITGHDIMGDVKGKRVVIYDDMISSGKTVLECVKAVEQKGAKEVISVCASHGLFVGKANEYLDLPFLENITITDTVAPFRITNESVRKKLSIINTTSLFAQAIKRIHADESISDLINNHIGIR